MCKLVLLCRNTLDIMSSIRSSSFCLLLQGAAIAVKIALDNIDMFAGMVFFAPAVIICPRWLSTSSAAVVRFEIITLPKSARLNRLRFETLTSHDVYLTPYRAEMSTGYTMPSRSNLHF